MENLSINDPQKLAPGTIGAPTTVATNITRLSLTKNTPIYKYDVQVALIGEDKGKEFVKVITKGANDDHQKVKHKQWAQKAYKNVVIQNKSFFGDGSSLFYDCCANLYTTKKLNLQTEGRVFEASTCEVFKKPGMIKRVEVLIKPVAETFQVSTNDIKNCVRPNASEADKTLLEALNVIVSAQAYDDDNIITYGNCVHYLIDLDLAKVTSPTPDLPGKKYVGAGVSKAVKVLEGEKKGEPTLFAVTEVKKTAFHEDNTPFIEKLRAVMERGFKDDLAANTPQARAALKQLKGLTLCVTYKKDTIDDTFGDNPRTIKLKSFGPSARDSKFTKDGVETTIEKYFQKDYGVQIKHPKLFTVTAEGKKGIVYPCEMLRVADSQRVTLPQQTPTQQADMIKLSAVPPKVRQDETKALANYVGINSKNDSLKAVGLQVAATQEVVSARVLPAPNIAYNNSKNPARDNCKWTGGKFVNPASCKSWTAVLIETGSLNTDEYLRRLYGKMVQGGMTMPQPKKIYIERYQHGSLQTIFANAKKENNQLLFFIVRDDLDLHQQIKAFEHQFDLLTQEVRLTKSLAVVHKGQNLTLENVVAKTNVKLGGLNHRVEAANPRHVAWVNEKSRIFIGIEGSFGSASSDSPGILGYSANSIKDQASFVGDWYYYDRSNEAVENSYLSTLCKIVHKVALEAKTSRNCTPSHLMFYLNGISEGMFEVVRTVYRDAIVKQCKAIHESFNPQITIIAVSKSHNERLYREKIPQGRPGEQNIAPGTVVDTRIVSAVHSEFYLNSHLAFQGTAKTPKYTVLHDTSKAPLDVLEGISHHLCFLHQIVNSTVALPAPLVIADRYAKRGHNMYQQNQGDITSFASSGSSSKFDFDKLNKLNYNEKSLAKTRFNA